MQPTGSLKPRAPKPDPSAALVECEIAGCAKTMPVGDSYSFIGGIATTGPSHIPPFVCGEAEQHFGCCIEHALLAYVLCLRDHVVAVHQEREAAALDAIAREIAAEALRLATPQEVTP
jgi:hypothetical protein